MEKEKVLVNSWGHYTTDEQFLNDPVLAMEGERHGSVLPQALVLKRRIMRQEEEVA